MLRKSLQDLLLECRKIKVAYQIPSYSLHDYEDGAFAEFRVNKIASVAKLAALTKGFEVRIYAEEGSTILTIYENYNGD